MLPARKTGHHTFRITGHSCQATKAWMSLHGKVERLLDQTLAERAAQKVVRVYTKGPQQIILFSMSCSLSSCRLQCATSIPQDPQSRTMSGLKKASEHSFSNAYLVQRTYCESLKLDEKIERAIKTLLKQISETAHWRHAPVWGTEVSRRRSDKRQTVSRLV